MEYIILLWSTLFGFQEDMGPLSVYAPGDGQNAGQLACGGKFTRHQVHIAHRRWRKLGCGRELVVYSEETGRAILTSVQDAGPFGIVNGRGEWKAYTQGLEAPAGWRFRGAVDLSWGAWIELGRPRFLTKVRMIFLPHGWRKTLENLLERGLPPPGISLRCTLPARRAWEPEGTSDRASC